uniref:Uncharacterized protein n=1 Tax=Amphimedon queenslandica TaxID=400682 RepID=A0A1X7VK69_AMPQE
MADDHGRDAPAAVGDGSGGGEDETREHLLSPAAVRQITDAILAALAARGPHTLRETPGTAPTDGTLDGVAVDPTLAVDEPMGLPSLLSGGTLDGVPSGGGSLRSTMLITEGLPPIPVKILERIKRWEFVDLSQLIQDPEDSLMQHQSPEGVVIFQSMEHAQRRRKSISNIFTWTKVFSIYTAALSGTKSTSKEECMGLGPT